MMGNSDEDGARTGAAEDGERDPDYASLAVGALGLPRRGPRVPFCDDASGLPVDAEAPQKRRHPNAIASAAVSVLAKLGVSADAPVDTSVEDAMLAAWPGVAGEELADKLIPEKFVGGILYVLARNNTELFEIRRFKLRPLEERARRCAAFTGLRQIRVRVK